MLTFLLYPIVRFALWVYFRRIEVRGCEQVPRDRPILFVSNHPNVMLDTLLLGTFAPGPTPRFLGKITLFKRRLYAFFLRQLGVIPVTRQQDGSQRLGRNQDMLKNACRVLTEGANLALFPEGHSHADTKVRPLKPGAARIALRVEDEAGGNAGVCIVPVGLAYTAPDLFRSEVAIHFGAPIEVVPHLEAYRQNKAGAARQLTEEIHQRLTGLTWHVANPALESAISHLQAIYSQQLEADLPVSAALSRRLRAGQELIEAAHSLHHSDPQLFARVAQRLRLHQRKLARMGLAPYTLLPGSGQWSRALLAILLAPLALYGVINNALPYIVPRFFVSAYRQTPEMIGTVKLSLGASAFPLYYCLVALISGMVWNGQTALLYLATLPPSGLFVLFYNEHLLQRLPLWQRLVTPGKRARYLRRLAAEQDQLITDIDGLKDDYVRHREQRNG